MDVLTEDVPREPISHTNAPVSIRQTDCHILVGASIIGKTKKNHQIVVGQRYRRASLVHVIVLGVSAAESGCKTYVHQSKSSQETARTTYVGLFKAQLWNKFSPT